MHIAKRLCNIQRRFKAKKLCLHSSIVKEQIGGAERDRTADLLRARQALSQLSYSPKCS
jgi:hypothetical protein